MSFPRYPAYKLVRLDFAAEVPPHWTVGALKRIASLRSGDAIGSEQIAESGEYPVYGGNGLRGYTSSYTHDGHFALIGRQGALCGNVNYASGRFWASEHAVVVTPRHELETTWLGETLRAMNLNQYSVSAAQPGLSVGQLGELRVAVPPYDEQSAIAGFLSSATAKIDALVAEQRQLMELLQEKRQAVISHAVTKGLNPDVPMKPSGIEWLGEVPENWVVMPIRWAARLESGHTPSRQHPEYWVDCTVPWFTLADVWQIRDGKADYVYETKEKVSELGLANSAARLLPKDTVMLSRTASVGFSAIMGTGMATTQDFANWVCGERLRPEFLLYVFRAMQPEFRRLMMGSTHNTIYMPDIQAFRFALPPLEEQQAIVAHVSELVKQLDGLVEEVQRAEGLLLERRAALISAAVTGQIDVRQFAAAEAA